MNVALVYPRFRYPSGDPPLGLAYLASRLRQRTGLTPTIIDTTFARDPMAAVADVLSREKFDLVGISYMVTMAKDALAVAALAKELQPRAWVVMGGPQATMLPERTLAHPAVDAVAAGEGEDTLVEIVQKGRLEGVPGVWLKQGDSSQPPAPREPVADLDSLPFPALDLLAMERYLASWFQLDTVRPGLRGAPVLATRGCPFQCAYCQPTLDRLFGRKLRKRSPTNLASELTWLKERFGINAFLFTDDTFVVDPAWAREVCEELLGRRLGLIWGCNFRADLADRDLFRCMSAAGLRKIYVGIECYSDTVRCDVLDKRLLRDQVAFAVAAARAEGIRVQGYFMLGSPTETRRDVLDTVRYARRLKIDDAVFSISSPLPGSYLDERYRGQVLVEPEDVDYYRRFAFRPWDGIDQRFLSRAQKWAYLSFYLRPARLARLVRLLLGPDGRKRMWLKLRRVFG